MALDVVDLLRELDFGIDVGRGESWLLRAPDGRRYMSELFPAVDRITAQAALRARRAPSADRVRPLIAGETITANMLERARKGELDVLTERPLMLVIHGRVYPRNALEGTSEVSEVARRRPRGKPPWIRWATMRCLLFAQGPLRQAEVSASLQISQQAVSTAIQQMSDLVISTRSGFLARDKKEMLQEWTKSYAGTNGQVFGWYSLDPIVGQTERAARISALYEVDPLISGDVAADRLAPWGLPTAGLLYVKRPIDLSEDGFVAAPLDQATLVTCIPRDPTLWGSANLNCTGTADPPDLADPVIVYWDVLHGKDVDSQESAFKISHIITG